MSSPLALAVVTAALCDLLNDGLIDNDLSAIGSVTVTALPPDRIETGATETNRLNLFLYQVSPNLGWRNEGLPSHDSSDARIRLSNPPLALDLHYMLTAYGSSDFAAEVLLGYGMDLLHEARVLTRKNIRDALSPTNPVSVALIPADPDGRKAIDLADQIEQVKISPHYLSSDELSRMWTAMQARYRPTMAYQVSTVLIQGRRATRAALPVLERGKGDRGVTSQPHLGAPAATRPTLSSIRVLPAAAGEERPAAELGDSLELTGALLAGDNVVAEFIHPLFAKAKERTVAQATDTSAIVILPQSHDATLLTTFETGADAEWPAGTYTLRLRIERTGKLTHWTNVKWVTLAPRLRGAPVLSGASPALSLTVTFFPDAWPDQTVVVLVGGQPFSAGPIATKKNTVTTSIQGVAKSDVAVPVTLRVDDVSSQLLRNRSAQPPQFDPQQKVTLPV